jgi:tetratricopeptide (TPR) repeat protein
MGRSIRNCALAVALSCNMFACSSESSAVLAPTLEELYSSSVAELRRGDFTKALEFVDRGLLTVRESDSESAGRFKLLKAEVLLFRRDQQSARALLAERFPDTESFAAVRARQQFLTGLLHVTEGRLDEAVTSLEHAARIGAGAPDVVIDAKVLQGQAFVRSGRWDDAEITLNEALSLAEQQQDRFREASALHNLGMSRLLRSRFDAALPYFERVLSFREFETFTLHATALTNVAMCYARLGEFDQAVKARTCRSDARGARGFSLSSAGFR